LNERLTAQQGGFLCPADLGSSFVTNLQEMDGWSNPDDLRKLLMKLDDKDAARQFARNLKHMNNQFRGSIPRFGRICEIHKPTNRSLP
jgi:hypothetical protein